MLCHILYVMNVIHERLVAVMKCDAYTGQYFARRLNEVLNVRLDIKCKAIPLMEPLAYKASKGFSALLSGSAKFPIQVCVVL